MKNIVNNSNPTLSTVIKFKLQSMGLVKLQGDNVFPSCNLSRRFLRI